MKEVDRLGNVVDIKEAERARDGRSDGRSKTALVLTGGGFVGGVYQIGALRALDLLGVDYSVNDFDVYVGTSCGAFIGSLVANGARPEELMQLLDGDEVPGYEPLDLSALMRPNVREIVDRGIKLPFNAARILRDIALNFRHLSLVEVATMLAELAPGGFYSLDGMTEMLQRQLDHDGFTDDFRELANELYIVATDLDTAEPVVFGDTGWDEVPISRAAAASASLPLVYSGVEIRGREFVDGGVRSHAHIETAVRHGADLVIIINPIVPFNNSRLSPYGGGRARHVSEMGLTHTITQVFKTLVWSAMHERLEMWRNTHPDVDFILIEPHRNDELMFSTQIMNVSHRVQIARHGFESVTGQLSQDFDHYRDICRRHGIKISRRAVIDRLRDAEKRAQSTTSKWQKVLEEGA